MNKIYMFLFVSLLGVGLLVSNSYASSSMGKSGAMTFNNQNLIGCVVKDSRGKDLGRITRVITGKTDDTRFALVVRWIHDDGFRDRTFVAVPMATLKVSEMKSGKPSVIFRGNDKDLYTAWFDPSKVGQANYDASIYRHYGLAPYWTDNGIGRATR